MNTTRRQRTIRQRAQVVGHGYWSGKDVRVDFRPAAPDTGVIFVRDDLSEPARIPARVEYRVESPRRTTLRRGRVDVEMVEHVLAALAGMRVDNCEIWVNQPEMPGCDGSSLPFVEALEAAGIVEQNATRGQLVVRELTRLGDEESWIEARPHAVTRANTPHHSESGAGLSVRFRLDYGSGNAIGRQTYSLRMTPDAFRRELAPSRTFMLKHEADWLRNQGLGRRVTHQDLLIFDDEGPIENELRFPDECARHKTLDVVGDLALAGCDIVGQVFAHRSGHRLNAELVRALLTEANMLGDTRRSA